MVKYKKIHFIGIGGIGVSSLARYHRKQNVIVTGSDNSESELTKELKRDGIKINIPQKSANVPKDADLVIYSQAIVPDHPERVAARDYGIPELSYPQAVGELTKTYETVAIAGAHGKSTTSAMTALMMEKAKKDPTVIIGTKLKEFGNRNFRAGRSRYLVLESDEYGRALLNYRAKYVIVTNLDKEHLDTYKDVADIQKTFLKFFDNSDRKSVFVLCKDSDPLYALKNKVAALAKRKSSKVIWYSVNDPETGIIRKTLTVPGTHNVSNALAVYHLGRSLKIPEKTILQSLHDFSGTWRRMQKIGQFRSAGRKTEIYDDYAHHPTEIKATLQAFREKYPKDLLVCVFEPHQAKRLNYLFKEFTEAFRAADETIILPLYRVAGRDISSGKNARDLVSAIRKRHTKDRVAYLNQAADIVKSLEKVIYKKENRSKDAIIAFLGAGSITRYSKQFVEELERIKAGERSA